MRTASADGIKKHLMRLLEQKTLDYTKILDAAAELAATDQSSVRFSVDADHVSRLGRELVSKRETALGELVKNAYDADATSVTLTFEDTEKPGGTLTISDNGSGMTRDDIVDGFMRISTDIKHSAPFSDKFGRQRAGSKGIGRFAVQRLGSRLVLETRSEKSESGFKLTINWDAFERQNDLQLVSSPLERLNRSLIGTVLRIENLRDSWSPEDIERLRIQLAPLVQPFPLSLAGKRENADVAGGFEVYVQKGRTSTARPVSDVYPQFFDVALATISGGVNAKGSAEFRVESERFGLDEKHKMTRAYPQARGVRFIAHYYIRSAPFIPAGIGGSLKTVLNEQGGIRVYRNGFRVLPYGEKGNDWLRLDEQYRRRDIKLLDPIGNQNFLGFVALDDPTGERFEETSSREGLIENEAFEEMREFLFSALFDGVKQISMEKARRSAAKSVPSGGEIRERIRSVIAHIDQYKAAPSARQARVALETIDSEIRVIARDFRKLDAARLDELSTLRILATLGISLAEFIHEVRGAIGLILSDLARLAKRSQDQRTVDLFKRLERNALLLRSYTSYFNTIITANEERMIEPREMHLVARSFEALAKPIVNEQNINIDVTIEPYSKLYSRPMHSSEWSSILLNLLSNSVKAIKRSGSNGQILVNVRPEGRSIVVDFCDNGDGIPPEHWSDVFLPFYSTTNSELAKRGDEVSGMGMGLKIVKDIVEANGGTISVVEAPGSWSTCFRIVVPQATASQVERLSA